MTELPQKPGMYLWHVSEPHYLDVGVVHVTEDSPKHLEHLKVRLAELGGAKAPFLVYRTTDGHLLTMYYTHDHMPPLNKEFLPCVDGFTQFNMHALTQHQHFGLYSPFPCTIFVPMPKEACRTDDDCAAITWQRGPRKMLTVHLACYGSPPAVKCGLANPPGGVVEVPGFDEGWAWFCGDSAELPPSGARHETQGTIGTWIDNTFPGADPESPRKALRALEEMVELCFAAGASPTDVRKAVQRAISDRADDEVITQLDKIPAEAADVAIVLLGYAQLRGFDLQAEIDKKMAINRKRKWKANGDGTGYHIKENQS